jgi:hypothetical protein
MDWRLVFLIAALVCFIIDALGVVSQRLKLLPIGLALFVCYFLVRHT